jgi:hypothetical protein
MQQGPCGAHGQSANELAGFDKTLKLISVRYLCGYCGHEKCCVSASCCVFSVSVLHSQRYM